MSVSSGAIRAGQAFVEILTDNSKLVRGLRMAQRHLHNFGSAATAIGTRIAAVGTMVAAPMLMAVRSFAGAGDALDKMSSRVGASVEFLSALGHAAQIGGTDISAMEVGIRRMQRTAMDATRGLSTATDAFDELGISVTGADGVLKGTEELFMESAAALAKIDNNTRKAALSTMIFGRAGTSLLPMLKDGADGLQAVMQEARDLGIVMSTEDATAAAELTDAWTRMISILKMGAVHVGATLAPMLTNLAGIVKDNVRPVLDWIRAHGDLIAGLFKTAAVAVAVGTAIVALGTVAGALGSILGGVATVISTVSGLLAAVLSPIGLITAAAIALGAYLVKTTGAGGAAIGWLAEQFQYLQETVGSAMGAVGNALAAGNLDGAAKVLWETVKLVFAQGLHAVERMATQAWFAIAGRMIEAWTGIKSAWVELSAAIQNIWAETIKFVSDAWFGAQNQIANGIAWVIMKAQGIDEQIIGQTLLQEENRHGREQQERDQAHANRLATIEDERTQAHADNVRAEKDTLGQLDAMQQERAHKINGDLARAKADWEAALSAVESASNNPSMPAERKQLFDVLEDLNTSGLSGGKTTGTFSAFAASRMGDNGLQRAAEQTAQNTKRIVEILGDNPDRAMVWGH